MKKKILIKLFLISLFLFLSIFFFYKYFIKEPQIIKKTIPDKNLSTKNLEKNLITDLRYFSIDDKGNKYEITSKYAKYNIKNYDTNYKENILVKHVDNKLNGENLDLSFQNNLMLMYNNIIYQNLDTKLLADKLEIDLITKDSKIIMNDKKSKIKIIKKK